MKKLFEIYERNLALEAVRVTEAAALSASSWIGLGDEKISDSIIFLHSLFFTWASI